MSALNNLRKKETFLTLGEDELLAEMVRNYPFFYDKTWTQGTKKQVIETQKRNKRNNNVKGWRIVNIRHEVFF